MAQAGWMHEAGHSKRVLWESSEEYGVMEVGGGFGMAGVGGWGGHMYTRGRFMSMYSKTITIL